MKFASWAYLIIGTIVAIISFSLGQGVLAYLGIGVAVFGAVRIFILRTKKVKKQEHTYTICPYCSATVSKTDNYCAKCGKRLRNI
ncbi:MAG: hypothetical protein KJ601_05435 [Nanoarchaeota archaeon]|nr:hypothetical protein [Nanoarchaeota archaeon]MBU1704158.1 hypothetical protein [Nanoarchaeota archaeon]